MANTESLRIPSRETLFPVGQTYLESSQKRLFDIISSILLMPCIFPAIAISCLTVLIEQKDNPIVTIVVSGKDNVPLHLHKLKTLKKQSHDQCGTTHNPLNPKKRNDTRITSLGRILRRFSIDEFVQIVDVLTGNISMVGNRPMFQNKVDALRSYPEAMSLFPHWTQLYESWLESQSYSKRGATGLVVLKGRGELDQSPEGTRKRLIYERFYNEHASLGFDIQILSRTIKAMIVGKGAF